MKGVPVLQKAIVLLAMTLAFSSASSAINQRVRSSKTQGMELRAKELRSKVPTLGSEGIYLKSHNYKL